MGASIIERFFQYLVTAGIFIGANFFLGEVGLIVAAIFTIGTQQYYVGNLMNRVKELEEFRGNMTSAHDFYEHPLGKQTFWHGDRTV